MNYREFLESKVKRVDNFGFEVDKNTLNDKAFDFQRDITSWALKKGKAAIFADCGLGKTIMQGEWANQIFKHTGENILILAPLGVTLQTKEELQNVLNIDSTICRSQDDVMPGINITNYEMLGNFNPKDFIGVILDESSILKNFTGSTRIALTETFKDTPFKLCCTATPAPNDYIELLNHADFLNVMETSKALATWFINDMKTGDWRLKGHAIKDFWRWVSSWSVYIKTPSDIGYSDEGYILPEHNEIVDTIKISLIDKSYNDGFLRKIETSATSFHKEKRNTADARAKRCAELVNQSNEQYIIWCDTDYESELLKKYIPEAVEVRGSHKPSFKEESANKFKNGNIRVLISKPKIFGYGMNFQRCHNAIFCGLTYSYENYYQAVKRLLRFGQRSQVNTIIVMGSTEKHILETVRKKQEKQRIMELNIMNSIKDIQLSNFNGKKKIEPVYINNLELPKWLKEA
ncbi:Superfamily II DNA or RNA helicase [Clostridium amylolyticum]|uniref:Superfamily II DNA or RNA helicase n=1 Tax=Clostridium amylolyticum TaxID=1121298 RepID=A0A1M6L1U3_9CLOT|nr:DEAD/DEAH box helicase [Clostridium amylolyticum]SHJ65072.1 Superfamily II DNA or RNA helicase [Clostridium amylolyticum]